MQDVPEKHVQCFSNVQTNGYDLQAIMFPIVCTHDSSQSSNGNKLSAYPRSIWHRQSLYNHLGHTVVEKYDNNRKDLHFLYGDDAKMSNKCLLSII